MVINASIPDLCLLTYNYFALLQIIMYIWNIVQLQNVHITYLRFESICQTFVMFFLYRINLYLTEIPWIVVLTQQCTHSQKKTIMLI